MTRKLLSLVLFLMCCTMLFAANNVILLGMSTAIIKMPQRYVLYLVCGVGLILALNYEAIIVTAKKILKR